MTPRTVSPYITFSLTVVFLLGALATLFFMVANNGRAMSIVPQYVIDGGSSQQGPAAIQRYGCGSCHMIPGVTGAVGVVGPSLDHFGSRSYIAGHFPNVPDNLIAWLMHPQQMLPKNAMPEMNVSDPSARDIAAYLYTLK